MQALLLLTLSAAALGKRSEYASRIYRFNTRQKQTVIGTHNYLRSLEPAQYMQELVWDEGLADLAANWAERCMAIHRTGMERSRTNTSYPFVGENMWWSNEEKLRDMGPVIRDFYSEKKDYTFNNRTCTRGKLCGHYTAVTWAKTCAVGCAAAKCDKILFGLNIKKGHMIVCNYGPGGNRLSQWPYVVGDKCSGCPGQCNKQGLCPSTCSGKDVQTLPAFNPRDFSEAPILTEVPLGPPVSFSLFGPPPTSLLPSSSLPSSAQPSARRSFLSSPRSLPSSSRVPSSRSSVPSLPSSRPVPARRSLRLSVPASLRSLSSSRVPSSGSSFPSPVSSSRPASRVPSFSSGSSFPSPSSRPVPARRSFLSSVPASRRSVPTSRLPSPFVRVERRRSKARRTVTRRPRVIPSKASFRCVDEDAKCHVWALLGECLKNPVFMNRSCQLSCSACRS